jgi:hypothetical protein
MKHGLTKSLENSMGVFQLLNKTVVFVTRLTMKREDSSYPISEFFHIKNFVIVE